MRVKGGKQKAKEREKKKKKKRGKVLAGRERAKHLGQALDSSLKSTESSLMTPAILFPSQNTPKLYSQCLLDDQKTHVCLKQGSTSIG